MPVQTPLLRIGTRGSPLAMVQAGMVRDEICGTHGLDESQIEIVVIRTTGDKVQDRPLSELGGKGLFTKEIEDALIENRIDLAVHSMKDVPTVLPDGLVISTLLAREDPRDAFFSHVAESISGLPPSAIVGSASLRRGAQVKRLRPDIDVVNFRGNVETRLRKLRDGDVHATFLALAGVRRLGIEDRITSIVDESEMLPAIAQGAIGIEVRQHDDKSQSLLASLDVCEARITVTCERAFLSALDGSCRTPIAGLARLDQGRLRFRGLVISPDGRECLEAEREGAADDAEAMGGDAGEELIARGGGRFITG